MTQEEKFDVIESQNKEAIEAAGELMNRIYREWLAEAKEALEKINE